MTLLLRIAVFAAALFAPQALADVQPFHPYLNSEKKHLLLLGYTWQKADVEVSAQRDPFSEVSLDLDDLGTDDTYNSWLLEYRYRINENWGLVAGAFTFEVDGNRTAQRDFNFDGKEFEAGVALDTSLDVDTYIVDVMYTAYRSDRSEVLVGGGLHMFDFNAEVTGRAFVDELEGSLTNASDDILAPLPNLRAQGFYAFTPRLAGAATLGWLSASVGDFDGDFLFLHARLFYRFQGGFGVSAGYQITDIDLEQDKSNGKNEYNIAFDGPTVQLSYAF